MARTPQLSAQELTDKLSAVFRRYGYEGASMSILSKATNLQRASLYHRFPGGKEEMAQAVLTCFEGQIRTTIIEPLQDENIEPRKRAKILTKQLNEVYDGGKNSCILNIFAPPFQEKGLFSKQIQANLKELVSAITILATALNPDRNNENLAREVVMLFQGGLVMSRGIDSTRPFKESLKQIEKLLLDDSQADAPTSETDKKTAGQKDTKVADKTSELAAEYTTDLFGELVA